MWPFQKYYFERFYTVSACLRSSHISEFACKVSPQGKSLKYENYIEKVMLEYFGDEDNVLIYLATNYFAV